MAIPLDEINNDTQIDKAFFNNIIGAINQLGSGNSTGSTGDGRLLVQYGTATVFGSELTQRVNDIYGYPAWSTQATVYFDSSYDTNNSGKPLLSVCLTPATGNPLVTAVSLDSLSANSFTFNFVTTFASYSSDSTISVNWIAVGRSAE